MKVGQIVVCAKDGAFKCRAGICYTVESTRRAIYPSLSGCRDIISVKRDDGFLGEYYAEYFVLLGTPEKMAAVVGGITASEEDLQKAAQVIAAQKSKQVQIPVDLAARSHILDRRAGGDYQGIGFFLAAQYNWEIKTDKDGVLVLIPTKK